MGNYFLKKPKKEDSENGCAKKDEHYKFMTIDACLTDNEEILKYLPINYHKYAKEIKDVIRVQAELTVMIETSGNSGTGLISGVRLFAKDTIPPPICYCDSREGCENKAAGEIKIRTAEHVLNKSLPNSVVCKIFYDTDFTYFIIRGSEIKNTNKKNDTANVICKLCKEELLTKLKKCIKERELRRQRMVDVCKMDCNLQEQIAIIVSHPHGDSKKVSIGRVDINLVNENFICYDTPTCAGSSGADVMCFGGNGKPLVHSGYLKEKNKNIAHPYIENSCSLKVVLTRILQRYFLLD